MTDTEYRIVMALSDVCTAVSRMNRVLRDRIEPEDYEHVEESLQLAVKAGQPLMDDLMARLKQGPLA